MNNPPDEQLLGQINALCGALEEIWDEAHHAAALPQLRAWHRDCHTFVYFIASGSRVKIGVSRKPESRRGHLQTSTPDRLRLLAVLPGSREREAILHERFADGRLTGEWFDAETPGLEDAIEGASVREAVPWDFESECCKDLFDAAGFSPPEKAIDPELAFRRLVKLRLGDLPADLLDPNVFLFWPRDPHAQLS